MAEWHDRAKKRASELKIRQEDLQRLFGVETRGAVGHYLSGRRDPPVSTLAPLADRLQMTLDQMLRGDGSAPSQPVGLDLDKLTDLIETVEAAVAQSGRALPPRTKARILARLYVNDQASAASSPEAVRAALASLLEAME